jgi:hypothetical protein
MILLILALSATHMASMTPRADSPPRSPPRQSFNNRQSPAEHGLLELACTAMDTDCNERAQLR